jgi:hypothetical protein
MEKSNSAKVTDAPAAPPSAMCTHALTSSLGTDCALCACVRPSAAGVSVLCAGGASPSPSAQSAVSRARALGTYVELSRSQLLCPGFIDTHTHASQYTYMGCGRIPLLQWLEKYTFPTESKFKDTQFARAVYDRAVRAYIRNGTTCAACMDAARTAVLSPACAAAVHAASSRSLL